MALPKHWLDDVLENISDEDEFLHVMHNSPEMQKLVAEAFAAGERQRQRFEREPKLMAPSPAQVMREEFVRTLNTQKREEALAHVD